MDCNGITSLNAKLQTTIAISTSRTMREGSLINSNTEQLQLTTIQIKEVG